MGRGARWPIAGAGLLLALAGISLVAAAQSPIGLGAWLDHPVASLELAQGENPYPVRLVRPNSGPLSAMAQLGRDIFYDASLSASGKLACASCHSPKHHYGPPNDLPAFLGGPDLKSQGTRAVPSLMYLERDPAFTVGPDDEENENATLSTMIAASQGATRAQKTAKDTAQTAVNLVPQGGLFWDGRVDTLQDQAIFPLLNPREMDNGSADQVVAKLARAPYATLFTELFGPTIFGDKRLALSEALFAVARYEIEEPSFHPYTSKFDYWLEGKAAFTPEELRGYILFNDPDKANCGGCHVDQPGKDGLPPLFTDHQFEALAVPRNANLAVDRDPAYYDLGICGPLRADMAKETQYCALFTTPTLRNVATRHVFFHNGVYHTLQQVMDFYDFRDTQPGKIYPRGPDGKIAKYDDVPRRFWANVDVTDPPFDRKLGETPAMTPAEERDIIAFLGTLTDGYMPAK